MSYLEYVELRMCSWPEVSVHPHRFGGREFRFRSAEIGHVHEGGIVDIPFPRSIRDALLDERLAEQHYWVPNSGWISFCVRGEDGLKHSLWLLRLSYLRYALKTAVDPKDMFEREADKLRLSARLRLLLQPFIRPSASARESTNPTISA